MDFAFSIWAALYLIYCLKAHVLVKGKLRKFPILLNNDNQQVILKQVVI
jgi:hypothetical protein